MKDNSPIVSVHSSGGDLVFVKQSGKEIRIKSSLTEAKVNTLIYQRITEAEARIEDLVNQKGGRE